MRGRGVLEGVPKMSKKFIKAIIPTVQTMVALREYTVNENVEDQTTGHILDRMDILDIVLAN